MDRRTRTLVVIGLAVALASLASFGVYRAIQRIPVREVPIAQRYQVVAKESLPVGTMLTKEQVRLAAWPADSPVTGGFTKVEDVAGRGITASIVENEPITENKLASRESGAGLPPTIPAGMRAMAVRVNDVIGVAGFAVPGTRVDVIVSVRGRNNDTESRAVVSNVMVLAAGTKIDQTKAMKEGQAMPTAVVTLLVTPQDAERLALAQSEGQIVLALRNPLDVAPAATAGIRLAGLMGSPDPKPVTQVVKGIPRVVPPPPPPPAPKPYSVDTIRGAKRTEEVIK
jgi:pilus assembly protein CpaB